MQTVELSELKNVVPKNSEKRINDIMNSISLIGQIEPVLVNANFMVLDGRARVEAMRRLGLERVIVEVTRASDTP